MNYAQRLQALNADTSVSEADKATLRKQLAEQEYGAKSFDINEFQELLGRLEASKSRQQRQKSVEGRRDIFAGGLASMMSNF
jgi:hypothetical protein